MSRKTVPQKTNAELQAAMREREKARGIVRVLVKIHETRVAEIKEIEREMRTPKPTTDQKGAEE